MKALLVALAFAAVAASVAQEPNPSRHLSAGIQMQVQSNRLGLLLRCDDSHLSTTIEPNGKHFDGTWPAIYTGIKVHGRWFDSRQLVHPPKISKFGRKVRVEGIEFGPSDLRVRENWTFEFGKEAVDWKIDRQYVAGGALDDTAMPKIDFESMSTWTGALLGTGGVAWGKLFDSPNTTYGVHTDSALFWRHDSNVCLQFSSRPTGNSHNALRFTRDALGGFSMDSEVSGSELLPKFGLSRFRRGGEDVWAGFPVSAGETVSATVELKAPDFASRFGRGDFKNLDTGAITELLNTIGRIGVIDNNIVGSNGWYSGYACLHEPWLGLVGGALDDPNYVRSYGKFLDFARDHGIEPDGMVKSRWDYTAGDATPGTYNQYGFYEAQWGRLMDSQTSYVTDVADEFDLNGDLQWVKGQKKACEAALGYLLRRDSNHNNLVEMANDSHTQKRSSDWIDIVWASWENALVNAELFRALLDWSKIEDVLGDSDRADYYRHFAAKLKRSFNKPTTDGGFWNEQKGWYIYWRDKDGSTHGDNLTLPVNLLALAEGICDDPQRRKTLLANIESRMMAEHLLSWPACFESFAPGEGANAKFPEYENGDIFLAWAECGIRAYAENNPEFALKYVRQIVDQYKKDGLAFQRYLRSNGQGAGDDILANNCNVILGLYRDIYGIQPKYNRLYLNPHLSPELNGTWVKYGLRGDSIDLSLAEHDYRVVCDGQTIASAADFGVAFGPGKLTFFSHDSDRPTARFETSQGKGLSVDVKDWGSDRRLLISMRKPGWVTVTFLDLVPAKEYRVLLFGGRRVTVSTRHPRFRIRFGTGGGTSVWLSEAG